VPDPATSHYLGVPGYLLLWLLTICSFTLFGRQVLHYGRILRRARPEKRWDRPLERVKLFLTYVVAQRRLLDEPLIGIAHVLIFWAFVFYSTSFFWNLLRGLFPSLPIPYADEVPGMAFALELLGALALLSVAGAAVRRFIFPPPRLERSLDATLILALIAVVLVTFLGGQGFKVLGGNTEGTWTPLGTFLAQALRGLGVDEASASAFSLWTWWIHMLTVLAFLAYLPYSKHLHLLVAPFNVAFGALRSGSVPEPSEGARLLEEFTWRQLLNALACAECGRCDRACPAFQSGFPLSPKMLVHRIKGVIQTPAVRRNPGATPAVLAEAGNVGHIVKPEELWACAACYACMERCPVFNEHVHLIVEMRRSLVAQGELGKQMQEALTSLARYGNSFGQPERARAKWVQALGFAVKDARKEPVEVLWFVGDYASFDPRVQSITCAAARVFQRAGVDFGILYEGERNAGNDVRRAGEEGLFEMLMERNLRELAKAQFRWIVTTDPHTYHALKNEYRWGENGQGNAKVLHHTELLESLLQMGKLPLRRTLGLTVTYHDPCYLGRCNGVFDPPRRLLKALGVKLVEMPRNRRNSFCCGAGGGRIWMEEVSGSRERPAEIRLREAAELPGVSTLVVACPKDLVMFQDAVKTAGLEGRITVRDVVELVEAAMQPAEEGSHVAA
jgi:Fe-S oxidoreductase/Flp pilus assembly pilin Flp